MKKPHEGVLEFTRQQSALSCGGLRGLAWGFPGGSKTLRRLLQCTWHIIISVATARYA
jgi:hypothetical protein